MTYRHGALALLTLTVLIVFTHAAAPAAKPLGTWTREAGDTKITFTITADKLRCQVVSNDNNITADAAYGVTEDGTLFAIITRVERQGNGSTPDKGDLFSFQYKINNDKLTIDSLKATQSSDEARQLVEGEYTKAK